MEAIVQQVFAYNDSAVSFKQENGIVYANPVDLSKPFGKHPKDWFRTKAAKEFIAALAEVRKCQATDLVQITNGVETWYHEDVALEFSRWLSPAFSIWCNDRIKELLNYGLTASHERLNEMVANPQASAELATLILNERKAKEEALQYIQKQHAYIQYIQPKADYFDQVLMSESTYVTDYVAKELGMSAISLNKLLRKMGVIMKRGSEWTLTAKYAGNKYTNHKTHPYTYNGHRCTASTMVWTERGRLFLHQLLNNPTNGSNNNTNTSSLFGNA